MAGQYSDSPLVVAVDSASPTTSVSVGWLESADAPGTDNQLLGSRETPSGRSSTGLLALLDDLLREHRLSTRNIERLIGNRGPGSFTGLRIGMATLMGLAESLEAHATAVTAFRALAAQAGTDPGCDLRTVALVDALRGEWFAQAFDPDGSELADPEIVVPERIHDWEPCRVVGFGLAALPDEVRDSPGVTTLEAAPLAPTLLEMGRRPDLDWDQTLLRRPLYLRAPAADGPRR